MKNSEKGASTMSETVLVSFGVPKYFSEDVFDLVSSLPLISLVIRKVQAR